MSAPIPDGRRFRVWAAVRRDGVVRADIRDFTDRAEWQAWTFDNPDVRWWEMLVLEPGEDRQGEGRHRKTCAPGAPCTLCHERAAKWWVEWARRRATREAEAEVGPQERLP